MKVHNLEIIHGDCMDVMKTYKDNEFDLAVVDPPYGYGEKETGILNFRIKEKEKIWNEAPNEDYFIELFRVSKNQIIWGGNYFPFIWSFGGRGFIYWHKGNPVPNFADGELAWTSFDRNAKQVNLRYYGNLEDGTSASSKIHPTQKPVKLYDWIYMNYAEPGQKVLDTHLGSGSNAIASHYAKMGEFVGIELDKDYYKAACKRIKTQIRQTTLF